jgi:hypothetical protein
VLLTQGLEIILIVLALELLLFYLKKELIEKFFGSVFVRMPTHVRGPSGGGVITMHDSPLRTAVANVSSGETLKPSNSYPLLHQLLR